MYLMNVPPVAATQTEWRTCGPAGGYSLPVCFNDSDPELSSRGTPISDKVQMIIESLRSTQSSLEMGDEIEGNVLSGREGHPQACKATVGSYVGARPKVLAGNRPADASSLVNREGNDSDSDDSVDRGIEEAILEYLKEKDGHKRKADPCFNFLESSKIPRKDLPVPEVSNQNANSNAFLIPTNQFPKSLKAETATAPAAIPIKKYIKHKASLEENTTRQFAPTKSVVLPKEQTFSKTISHLKTEKGPVNIKVEANLSDSSSDDGIEEAIQRYQLEKKEQQVKREVFNPHEFSEDSDSSSDDGIEEAIRHYQLEQLKEKSAFKPFLHKQTMLSKSLIYAAGSTSIENVNKRKLKKKKSRAEKEAKPAQPHPSTIPAPKSTLSESLKAKGNGFPSLKTEGPNEPPTPTSASVKVNTTAELMCAEAILDISKTVMPEGFHQGVSLSCYTPSESSLPDNGKDEESDGSSIDSEDGIEQEIRKFLEQKAQMHQQPTDPAKTPEAQGVNQQEAKAKQVTAQKKPFKLSLTQRRKHREEHPSLSAVENQVKETSLKPLPEHRKEPSRRSLQDREQSGDKSSSLDSDEDLDTAIKDLLKTKKKTKKKRDLKVKSRKCPKDEEPVLGNASQPKKLKHNLTSKRSALKKVQKGIMKDKFVLSKRTVLPHKQGERSADAPRVEMGNLKAMENKDPLLLTPQTTHQMRDDSSSVDSDDSIEQEIRRFLAEKAKGSTPEKGRDEDVSRNGTDVTSPQGKKDIKQEDQLAEIPRKGASPFVGWSPSSHQPVSVLHSSPPDIPSVGVQLHMSAVLPCSPTRLEPADGAGAAKFEQKRPSNEESTSTERVRQVPAPSVAHSCSESIKWRQSLGLPTTDSRTLSRTPFHITTSKIGETPSESATYQSGVITSRTQTPVNAWSSARTGRGPFQAEMTVNSPYRSTVLNLSSLSKQHPRVAFSRSFGPDHRPQCTMEGEAKSMVHIPKDKSVFVELESNRTNHVQVQSRERSEGEDSLGERKREGESVKIEETEVRLERREEEFIDEADCESGSRRSPEKKQGFPTL